MLLSPLFAGAKSGHIGRVWNKYNLIKSLFQLKTQYALRY